MEDAAPSSSLDQSSTSPDSNQPQDVVMSTSQVVAARLSLEEWASPNQQTFASPTPEQQEDARSRREKSGDAPVLSQFLRPIGSTMEYHNTRKRPASSLDGEKTKPVTQKLSRRQRSKRRKLEMDTKLCFAVSAGGTCPRGDKCRFTHDVEAFLATKRPDIGEKCYIYDVRGFCSYGLACRFGGAHIVDGKNIRNEELFASVTPDEPINVLSREVQDQLRRRKYPYPRADAFLKAWKAKQQSKNPQSGEKEQHQEKEEEEGEALAACQTCEKTETGDDKEKESTSAEKEKEKEEARPGEKTEDAPEEKADNEVKVLDAETIEEEILMIKQKLSKDRPSLLFTETRLRPEEKKKLDWKDKLYLAPLTTLGNLPYRRICKEFGADITCGEMALATNLLQGHIQEWALLKRHKSEDAFGVQVCGSSADVMTRCAELLDEQAEVDFVDINSGCPIDLVVNKGAGSALLERKTRMKAIVCGMSSVLSCPLTIKLRMGKDEKKPNAHKLIPHLESWGAAGVTLHGRSRLQRYSKDADWNYIKLCAKATTLPFLGNGDIYCWKQLEELKENANTDGVMVARGALVKPWIFTELKEKRDWDISSSERFEIMKDFVNYGLYHWGSDDKGIANTREFLLQWMSFLHRYVPVGLLERLPPRLRDRPPFFYGRNDLETLLASDSINDWIAISEMLLGPIPENFTFVPKHKANAYGANEG